MTTVFLRAIEAEDKAVALREAIRDPSAAQETTRFECDVSVFAVVPGSPFTYWLPRSIRHLFKSLDALESKGRLNRVGLQTSDNYRFLRLGRISSSTLVVYIPYAKGGGLSPYYRQFPLILNWGGTGFEVKAWAEALGNSPSRNVRSEELYFRPSLTYSDRCTGGLPLPPDQVEAFSM